MATENLFVFQIILDSIRLDPRYLCLDGNNAPVSWIRIGFQLLSFDVIVLDVDIPILPLTEDGDHGATIRKGKSCMFRMDGQEFINGMNMNPLSILVLEPPSATTAHLTRLIAFTCIDVTMNKHDERMSEWANVQSSWTLYNHTGDAVGLVQAGIVVSYLGTSLAPHLQHALGAVHITDVTTSPRHSQGEVEINGVGVMTDAVMNTVDSSVQCELEMTNTDSQVLIPSQELINPSTILVASPQQKFTAELIPDHLEDKYEYVSKKKYPPPLFYCHESSNDTSPDTPHEEVNDQLRPPSLIYHHQMK